VAREAGYENVLRLLHQLLASENTVRRSETGALAVEIAWLRAAELPKLRRVEEILAGHLAAAPMAPTTGPAPRAATAPRPAPQPAPPRPAPAPRAAPPARPPTPPPAAAPAPRPVAGDGDLVQVFLDEVSRRKQPLAAHLSEAEEITFADGRLTVVRLPGDTWLESRLQQSGNRQVIEESLAAVWGPGTPWRTVQGEGKRSPATGAQPAAVADLVENPTVQTVLDIFGGKVERVEERFREE